MLNYTYYCPLQKWHFSWDSSYTDTKKNIHSKLLLRWKGEWNQKRQNQMPVQIQQCKSLAICSEIWGAPDVSWKPGLIFLIPAWMHFLWWQIVNVLLLSQDHIEVHHVLKESSCNSSLMEFITFCLDSISHSLWPQAAYLELMRIVENDVLSPWTSFWSSRLRWT